MKQFSIGWTLIRIYTFLVYAFLFAPIVVVMVLAFNPKQFGIFPMEGVSFRWFIKLAHNEAIIAAFKNSLALGSMTAVLSTTIGILAAMAFIRFDFPGKNTINTLLLSPIMIPEVVLGVALLLFLRWLQQPKSFALLLIGHVVLTLPYVIHGPEDAKALTHGKIGDELRDNTLRDSGIRILGWAYSGCRLLTNSKQEVASPADLQGMVIRVPKNEIMISSYQSWGVNPNPLAWSETFTALQQGVVDGQDNPYITIDAMKFYEVQKYVTDSCYVFSMEPLIMGEGTFQSLSEEQQKLVLAAGEEATSHSYDYLLATEDSIKKSLVEEHGMTITQPANDEKEWIAKASSILPDC